MNAATAGNLFDARMSAADLDAYLARIGFSGPADATLRTLSELHRLHPQAIAFENLDPFLGRLPVKLDLASLVSKLVHRRRGGYCFEQNLLFGHVLTQLGFEVTGLSARLLWNQPPEAKTPRGHMLLKIHLDGEDHIADVGFGALTLTTPLRVRTERPQNTPHEAFRLVNDVGLLRLEARIDDGWRPVYRFDLQEQTIADYEITNFYLSSHPESQFRHSLIAARPFAEGRYTLLGDRLACRIMDGSSSRRNLRDADELQEVLSTLFRIEVPEGLDLTFAVPGNPSGAKGSRKYADILT